MDAHHELERIESDPLPFAPEQWAARARALSDVAVARELARYTRDRTLDARAVAVERALTAAHQQAMGAFAEHVRAGGRSIPADAADLDALLSALVGPEPASTRPLEPGLIHFQAAPSAVVMAGLALLELGPADCLLDVGSGLGHVALLSHLLTGARARGIELEPAYVDRARSVAARLGLDDVVFEVADARQADLGQPSAVFFFTPLVGEPLRALASRVACPLLAYGPGTPELGRARSWAEVRGDASDPFAPVLFVP